MAQKTSCTRCGRPLSGDPTIKKVAGQLVKTCYFCWGVLPSERGIYEIVKQGSYYCPVCDTTRGYYQVVRIGGYIWCPQCEQGGKLKSVACPKCGAQAHEGLPCSYCGTKIGIQYLPVIEL